jgi:hypothetical protein
MVTRLSIPKSSFHSIRLGVGSSSVTQRTSAIANRKNRNTTNNTIATYVSMPSIGFIMLIVSVCHELSIAVPRWLRARSLS